MNKKLTAKTQKLIPSLNENETIFSSSIAIEPPERDLVLKKGSVYTAFDVSSPVPLNVPLITKVINDVLYDSYYHSENISPIQSLEKAIVDINDKVSNLTAQAVSTQPPNTKQEGLPVAAFNIVAGVLWGNVLYMVQYGKGKSFLMRDGEIKEVSSTSEGNFSVASGVVKNGDVIVLNTEKFAERYPPEKLLDASITSNELEPGFSSIILKFNVDEEFSEDEVIDFGVKADKKSGKLRGVFQGASDKSKKKQKEQSIQSLVDTPISQPSPQPASQNMVQPTMDKAPPATTASITLEPTSAPVPTPKPIPTPKPAPTGPPPKNQPPAIQTRPQEIPKIKPKAQLKAKKERKKEQPNIKLKSGRGKKFNTKTLSIAAAILLSFSIFITLLVRNNRPNKNQGVQGDNRAGSSLFVPREFNKKEEEETPVQEEETVPEEKKEEVPTDQDALDKIARVDAQPFYDLKLADENAVPSEIVAFTNTLVVTDTVSGKVFTSNINTPKFVAEEQAFTGIKTAINYSGKLNFSDSEGYKVYDLTNSSLDSTYDIQTSLASRYLDNIYSVEGSEIVKYVTSGDEVTSSTWGDDPSLTGAKHITVSYSIYTVSSQDELVVFTSGEKTDFNISGLTKPLSKVTDLVANINYDNIYLADSGNNRVVVLDTDGNFVKQIMTEDPNAWSGIKSVAVNADETRMYVLNGSKVFEVDLTSANPPVVAGPELPDEDVIETDTTEDVLEEVETDGTGE
ncbi:hypothetical protein ACFLZK_02170 [Patescibacteria group bacterium]